MTTSAPRKLTAVATEIRFSRDHLHVLLVDGREIAAPLDWFPALRSASEEERKEWRLVGKGVGIHWSGLDEDISVAALLAG